MIVFYEKLEGTGGKVAGRCTKVLANGETYDWTCVHLSAPDAVLKRTDLIMTKVVNWLSTK